MAIEIERVGRTKDLLGESPLWDPVREVLYWVDIEGRAIRRHDPAGGETRSWSTPLRVGAMALRAGGGAVLAAEDGFHTFDFESGALDAIGGPLLDNRDSRFNDGKVDRQGRFLAGTTANDFRTPNAKLYRLNTNLTVEVLETDIIVSNGPCWSPDGGTFYFADSPRRAISAYDYDPDTGRLGHKRLFVSTEPYDTAPDGATVDAQGFVWTAFVLTGRIARFTPEGALDRLVEVPVSHPTSVMFGGPALDVLYVTSLSIALRGRPPKEREAGALLAVRGLGVEGLPEPRFGG